MSSYLIQIVEKGTKRVVEWEPGLKIEADLVDELCRRVKKRGVGIFRTEVHVVAAVRAALEELLYDLKLKV